VEKTQYVEQHPLNEWRMLCSAPLRAGGGREDPEPPEILSQKSKIEIIALRTQKMEYCIYINNRELKVKNSQ